jgi:hypothetical protein
VTLTRFSPDALPTMRDFVERAVSPVFAKRLAAAMHSSLVLSLDSDTFSALYDDAASAKSVDDLQPEHRSLLRKALEQIEAAPQTADGSQSAGPGANDSGASFLLSNVADDAKKNDVLISPTIKEAAKGSGGRLEGYNERLVESAALNEKVQRAKVKMPHATEDQIANGISDALRYAVVLPDDAYTQGIRSIFAALENKGFQPEKVVNYWQPGDIHNGVNAQLVNPRTGFRFQMMFHTDDSWQRKQQVALLAEHFMQAQDGKERKMLWDQMVKACDAVHPPNGVLEIGTLAQAATPKPRTLQPDQTPVTTTTPTPSSVPQP